MAAVIEKRAWRRTSEECCKKAIPTTAAFTRRELVVVVAICAILAGFLISALQRAGALSRKICCNCNLKQIGTAYRIWGNDNGGLYPAQVPETNGGWHSLLTRTNAAAYCWTNYVVMSNEMDMSSVVLVCPADERRPAASFSNLVNNNLSYFVGVQANDAYPFSLLGGDRNLGPGTVPDPEYGYSPANGQGNDVVIKGPVCWSLKMHSHGNPAGAGNILLGDGSAQAVSSASLRQNWLTNAFIGATNPGMRLIFP